MKTILSALLPFRFWPARLAPSRRPTLVRRTTGPSATAT